MSLLRNTDVKKHLGRTVPRFTPPIAQAEEVAVPVDSPMPVTETALLPEVTLPKVETV